MVKHFFEGTNSSYLTSQRKTMTMESSPLAVGSKFDVNLLVKPHIWDYPTKGQYFETTTKFFAGTARWAPTSYKYGCNFSFWGSQILNTFDICMKSNRSNIHIGDPMAWLSSHSPFPCKLRARMCFLLGAPNRMENGAAPDAVFSRRGMGRKRTSAYLFMPKAQVSRESKGTPQCHPEK